MASIPTTTVLNTPFVRLGRQALTESLAVTCRARADRVLSVDFTNVYIVAMRMVDRAFHLTTSSVDWFVTDSQILTWAASLVERSGHERVYGPDFLDYFIRHGDRTLTHYFLGGSQECLDRLLANLMGIQPDLRIVGSRNGYFKAEDEAAIAADINGARPDIVWVGLGTPKQQEWIDRWKPSLHAGALLAVGFAFDVNAGTKPDAPRWMGPLGLIWLYRLAREPRRLWKRYLYYNSVFLVGFFRQIVLRRTTPAPR